MKVSHREVKMSDLATSYHVDSAKVFTTCIVKVVDGSGKEITGIGTAKRNAEDNYNKMHGFNLSFRRALKDLADQFGDHD
jgi:hypothetical protein